METHSQKKDVGREDTCEDVKYTKAKQTGFKEKQKTI